MKKDLEEWIKGINFAAAFDKGAQLIEKTKKIFKKIFGQLKKRLYLCTRKKDEGDK